MDEVYEDVTTVCTGVRQCTKKSNRQVDTTDNCSRYVHTAGHLLWSLCLCPDCEQLSDNAKAKGCYWCNIHHLSNADIYDHRRGFGVIDDFLRASPDHTY